MEKLTEGEIVKVDTRGRMRTMRERRTELLAEFDLETTAIYTEVNIRQLQEVHTRCHPAARLAPRPTNG